MQFHLSTIFLVMLVVATSLGLGGPPGLVLSAIIFTLGILFVMAQRGSRTAGCLLSVCLVGIVIALILPAFPHAGPTARRSQCANNLKHIYIALENYRDVYGCCPPVLMQDEAGKPTCSWRVLILPFIEQRALYKQYDLDEPWDGPKNRTLTGQRPRCYMSPSDMNATSFGSSTTSYAAVLESADSTQFATSE